MTVTTPTTRVGGRRVATSVGLFTAGLCAAVMFGVACDSGAKPREAVEVAVAPAPAAAVVEAALAAPGDTGTLSGVVLYDGMPPTLDPLFKKGDATKKDPSVCAVEDMPDESLIVNKDNKGIANVFIYLQKAPAGAKFDKPGTDPVEFDQKGCRFMPRALLVRAGQTVLVKSGDGVPHNTRTAPFRNDAFNSTIGANDRKGVPIKYTKAEKNPIEVKCDFHTWMKAYHLVLDHPYMAVTDADGKFTIPNLPPGKHEFVVWQEKVGWLHKPTNTYSVEIKPGQTNDVKLSFGAKKFEQTSK